MKSIKLLVLAAVFAAITFVVTRFIQIPIPLGYFNIGNSIILIACYLIPSPYGIFVGAIGSSLADLTSAPEWTIYTLLIKALMPLVFYLLTTLPFLKKNIGVILSAAISMIIPVIGYTIGGSIIYGSVATGLTSVPGLIIEYAANLVLFSILVYAFEKSGIKSQFKTLYHNELHQI